MDMKQTLLLVGLVLAVMLVACGESPEDKNADDGSGETIGAEIASDYNTAMDKARNVEDQLLENKTDIDEAVEEADGTVKD
jgi:uncharacterized lipoprotein YehR (DUF1307 family)